MYYKNIVFIALDAPRTVKTVKTVTTTLSLQFLPIISYILRVGFPVVITLSVITPNTFFHLRRSITHNYEFITFTKKV